MEGDSEKTWVLVLAPPLNSPATGVEILALRRTWLGANQPTSLCLS